MTSPRRILAELGLTAHKGLGQNFLADPNLCRAIVRQVNAGPDGFVLEIGPGLGALTLPLLEAGCRVAAVEVDRGLAGYLTETYASRFADRLRIVNQDILKTDLAAHLPDGDDRMTVVGNLPYVISSPVLIQLLKQRGVVKRAVLMLQREVARRLTADPGSKDYGRLSVLIQYQAKVDRLLEVGPEVFFPRPKVGSTVVGLEFKDSPRPALSSPGRFCRVVAAGFAQRRKTLKNSMSSVLPADEVEAALAGTGIDPGRRGETLTVDEYAALANAWPGEGREENAPVK